MQSCFWPYFENDFMKWKALDPIVTRIIDSSISVKENVSKIKIWFEQIELYIISLEQSLLQL